MPAQVTQLRDRAGETEKITINLGYVDLGHVDLLVRQGYYSNRTDVIRYGDPQAGRQPPGCREADRHP